MGVMTDLSRLELILGLPIYDILRLWLSTKSPPSFETPPLLYEKITFFYSPENFFPIIIGEVTFCPGSLSGLRCTLLPKV